MDTVRAPPVPRGGDLERERSTMGTRAVVLEVNSRLQSNVLIQHGHSPKNEIGPAKSPRRSASAQESTKSEPQGVDRSIDEDGGAPALDYSDRFQFEQDQCGAGLRTILCRNNVAVTQESYTIVKAVDSQPPRGKCRSSKGDSATNMQLGSLNVSMGFRKTFKTMRFYLTERWPSG